MAADRGAVRITAVAPADCRLVRSPLDAAVLTRLACNTLRPAVVTLSVAGLGDRVLLIGGRHVSTVPGERTVLPSEALAQLAQWRLQTRGGADAAGVVELTIVAD
jgi:hypothetical protein